MRLPLERGPVSTAVVGALAGGGAVDERPLLAHLDRLPEDHDTVLDDDLQLALWTLYELHYRGFDEVDDAREWDPDLLRLRASLESRFEHDLRCRTRADVGAALAAAPEVFEQVETLAARVDGPSLARFVQREATHEQFLELMMARSLYHLKESDPTSFTLPRVDGPAKVALAELQYDEYGGGRPDRLHAGLFAEALRGCGLDATYGAYVDLTPAHTLAVNNAMSLFGLHRRLRGASLGHLGAFEMTSSLPCRRYAQGIRRLGLPEVVADYYDEHVEADAVHEQVALRDICGRLVADEPALHDDVLFGAATCLRLEEVSATQTLSAWRAGRSALVGVELREAM
ncbi:MAG TPA: iron-containing redox enzyme family protein [Nocardioides sp.]|nr:iron-containing redox enzyme family protein [Nocardioides sp.]